MKVLIRAFQNGLIYFSRIASCFRDSLCLKFEKEVISLEDFLLMKFEKVA